MRFWLIVSPNMIRIKEQKLNFKFNYPKTTESKLCGEFKFANDEKYCTNTILASSYLVKTEFQTRNAKQFTIQIPKTALKYLDDLDSTNEFNQLYSYPIQTLACVMRLVQYNGSFKTLKVVVDSEIKSRIAYLVSKLGPKFGLVYLW